MPHFVETIQSFLDRMETHLHYPDVYHLFITMRIDFYIDRQFRSRSAPLYVPRHANMFSDAHPELRGEPEEVLLWYMAQTLDRRQVIVDDHEVACESQRD